MTSIPLDEQSLGVRSKRRLNEFDTMGVLLNRHQSTPTFVGEPIEERGLAPGACTGVEPSSVVVVDLGATEREDDQLTALILYSGPPVTHACQGVRGSLDQRRGPRRPLGVFDLRQFPQFVRRHAPRARGEGGTGGDVVGLQKGGQLRTTLPQSISQGSHDPRRMGPAGRQPFDVVGCPLAPQPLGPSVVVESCHLAQDGIDESRSRRRSRLGPLAPGQSAGRINGSVVRDAHRENLMRPQPKDVEHHRLDPVQRSVHALCEDCVVPASTPQGPIRELSRECSISSGQSEAMQDLRQHQVRVDVVLTNCA